MRPLQAGSRHGSCTGAPQQQQAAAGGSPPAASSSHALAPTPGGAAAAAAAAALCGLKVYVTSSTTLASLVHHSPW
jgi:hypothetical protein